MTGRRREPAVALLALSAALLAWAPGAAAGIGIEASLDRDRIVAGGDPATLTIVVRSGGLSLPEPSMPRIEGLSIEPTGSAQNFSIVQGRIERSSTLVLRVRGLRAGSYTIPAIAIEAGGERAASNPLALTVLPAGAAPPGAGGQTGGPGSRESWSGRGGPPEVFARVVADRERAYWNQAIVVRLRVYTRVRLLDPPDWKPPEARGFWVEDLGKPGVERVTVDGVPYDVSEIGWAFFPTRAGQLAIGSARVRCRIERTIPVPDPWSSLGLPETEAQDITLQTRPLSVTVDTLPPGAPEGFAGAVGAFSLQVRVDRQEVHAGEPVTITTLVHGSGNIASLRDPEVIGPPGARRYVAGASTRIDRDGTALEGERSQQVSFLPGETGTLTLAPVRLAWFDPEEGRYRTASSDTIRVRVLPSAGGPGAGDRAQERFDAPLAAPRSRAGPSGPLAAGPPADALAVGSLALLGYAGAFAVARWRDRRARDPRAVRRARLDAVARSGLRDSRARLAAGDVRASAMLAAAALQSAVAARYDLSEPGATDRALVVSAQARGATPDELETVGGILERLDACAFGPPGPGQGAGPAAEVEAVEEIVRRYREELR